MTSTWYDIEEDKKLARKNAKNRRDRHKEYCNVQRDTWGYCSCGLEDSITNTEGEMYG